MSEATAKGGACSDTHPTKGRSVLYHGTSVRLLSKCGFKRYPVEASNSSITIVDHDDSRISCRNRAKQKDSAPLNRKIKQIVHFYERRRPADILARPVFTERRCAFTCRRERIGGASARTTGKNLIIDGSTCLAALTFFNSAIPSDRKWSSCILFDGRSVNSPPNVRDPPRTPQVNRSHLFDLYEKVGEILEKVFRQCGESALIRRRFSSSIQITV